MHRFVLLLLVLATTGSGCLPPVTAQAPAAPEGVPVRARIDHLIDSLPLRARIAQLVMPWIAGSSATSDPGFATALRWIDSLQVGGLIVSVGSPLEIAAKLNTLQRRSALPLLIASDLEGGTAFRFTGGTAFPTNMGVGATGSEEDAYTMGRITAAEGRAVGIHWTFAPVADVNNNPANPVINTRSFGADPRLVGRLVSAAIRGIQDGGMLATAKHFPGHGDTGTDSHIELPTIAASRTRLDSVELAPFRAAIQAGVAAVMSAHLAVPGLDGGSPLPATLSPAIMTTLLRDTLGFRGMVVTDALDMGAIVRAHGPGEAAVLAFIAGSDLLLQPQNAFAVVDAMEAAIAAGRITEDRLNASVRRVLEFKERTGLFARREVPLPEVPAVVGRAAHRASAAAATERSLVLVKDDQGLVDSLRRSPRRLLVVAYGESTGSGVGDTLARDLRRHGHRVDLVRLRAGATLEADVDSARRALAGEAIPVFVLSVRTVSGRGTLGLPAAVAELAEGTARARPSIMVSLGSPYILAQAPSVGGYLVGWTANPLTEAAAAAALSGAPITGRLPIPLPPDFPIGAGLERRTR